MMTVIRILGGVFVLLHGIVHALYAGHSGRLYELTPGLPWPEGSWLFSRFGGGDAARSIATAACTIAAIGFALGGVAILARLAWWRPFVVAVAAFSILVFLLFWNGQPRQLGDQGAIGLLVSLGVLVATLILGRTAAAP